MMIKYALFRRMGAQIWRFADLKDENPRQTVMDIHFVQDLQ